MQLTAKKIYLFKIYIRNLECTHIFEICKKYIYMFIYVSFTHGSKRGGMATCIVIYIKTDFINTYTHL